MEIDIIIVQLITLIIGFSLDKLLGDPSWLPHPIVLFGKLIALGEKRLNKGKLRRIKGAFLSLILVISTFVICSIGLKAAYAIHPILYIAIGSILVFFCLAGKTLIDEVKMVFEATEQSLERGRIQLSRIVGRDTQALSAQQVRSAALETLSENLSDGVIAPLFWFAIAGVPGMLAYKMINTLDSMVGYRNERYLYFGRFAARLDDVANFIPARLTALLMIVVSGKWKVFAFVKTFARRHTSPNAGYPESALAGILNGQFGGPTPYFGKVVNKPFIGHTPRMFNSSDFLLASAINKATEGVMIILVCVYISLSSCWASALWKTIS